MAHTIIILPMSIVESITSNALAVAMVLCHDLSNDTLPESKSQRMRTLGFLNTRATKNETRTNRTDHAGLAGGI